jgi:protein CpxP
MMKRLSFLMIATVLLANLVMAQPPQDRMRPRGMMGEPLLEELGLSDEQKAQIHQIRLETRKKNIDTEAKLKLARIELHELMDVDTPDQGKINTKITEVSQLREKIMRSHIESRLAVQKILTPEQRKKAKELRPQFRQRVRDFGGPGMMRRGGFGSGEDLDMPEPEDEL